MNAVFAAWSFMSAAICKFRRRQLATDITHPEWVESYRNPYKTVARRYKRRVVLATFVCSRFSSTSNSPRSEACALGGVMRCRDLLQRVFGARPKTKSPPRRRAFVPVCDAVLLFSFLQNVRSAVRRRRIRNNAPNAANTSASTPGSGTAAIAWLSDSNAKLLVPNSILLNDMSFRTKLT